MLDFLTGREARINVKYLDGTNPVIPTVGTATYTVYDSTGTVITGYNALSIATDVTTWQSTIVIPSGVNTIPSPQQFERRIVIVTFQSNGSSYQTRIDYRVIPFVPYTVTAENVRSFVGLEKKELPDSDVDLFVAYLRAKKDIGANLDIALENGTLSEVRANEAIAMQAVFELIPSLQQRVAQREENGLIGFDRIKIKDFSAIISAAYTKYYDIVDELLGITVGATYTLITVTQDADPVTG